MAAGCAGTCTGPGAAAAACTLSCAAAACSICIAACSVSWLIAAEAAAVIEAAAALEGCRLLSALDQDRASKRNDLGWGQDDTGVGHLLAEREELTEREAAHALRLLHHHRRQLPAVIRSRAFDAAIQPGVLSL